ncbi:ABC transporter substrate-binding protein [Algoriphagus halophytocola]|uniref:ABC transporter substrate-binding protein n=1 Tax=Algoriphagus halophytocola TaxID=2991499 RepID=A0ABY6MHI1_9BACT|nr:MULTISPECIES: ABC transporter substrate-binding protein [unclassified Algoriphagus]UZD23235.1 ABC transporter substrate-binding protein [Algoriphagus sp. TR-M5]WBL44529.1 ABC transporter substrate-binding protein [Algoriphagus sp. TR-M9]
MKTLRITGVPEHFNFPWKKVIAEQPFEKEGIHLEWRDESRGSGQMNKDLREDRTDLAIVLTESFLKDFESGNPSKMIGLHVKSPLTWGIHLHGGSAVESLHEIKSPSFLISRMGSGSQLMAFVLAKREGWDAEQLDFKIVNNLPGALEAMRAAHPEMFLWEKFTTNPWVDSKEMKRIGEIPSPWPCFAMVASEKALEEFGQLIFKLRNKVYQAASRIQDSGASVLEIAEKYKLEPEDVNEWIAQTSWETQSQVSRKQLNDAMEVMVELGIIQQIIPLENFLTSDYLSIID